MVAVPLVNPFGNFIAIPSKPRALEKQIRPQKVGMKMKEFNEKKIFSMERYHYMDRAKQLIIVKHKILSI